ncbi:hypothetical protein [Natrinema sp. HArc-T2]|uniref:hypothetical protein n=1 Tax=Natrinema sp. HArc-T2 TaxID=3242701 RepID=UPI00359DE0F7
MGQIFGILNFWLSRLFYATQLAVLLLALIFVVAPFDNFTLSKFTSAILLALLAVATVVSLWRRRTDKGGETYSETTEDITHDPFADPGQAAKDRWVKAIRRLPGRENEDD